MSADEPDAAPERALRPRWLATAFALLGLALIGLSVWAGDLVQKTHAAEVRKSDIQSVQSVARRVVTNFYSIKYTTFDQDAQRVYADLADKFKEQAVSQLGSSWKQTVVTNQLISSAKVATSGVINIGDKYAEVLVTVIRTSQSLQVKTPTSRWVVAQVQLTKVGGRWLVSGMGGLQ